MSGIGSTGQRACLAVPGADERKLAKAAALDADEIVIDLEDAVAPAGKRAARAAVASWLSSGVRLRGRVAVRVNTPGTSWCHRDIEACVRLETVHSIVVPKVESAADLAFVGRLLDGLELEVGRERPVRVQALIETAAGLAGIAGIVAATPRLDSLVLGYADLAASIGRSVAAGPGAWVAIQDTVLVAGRRAGLAVVDGPHLGVAVDDTFLAGVRHAADAGFDGKWVIHPGQIDAVTAAFTPAPDRIEWAERVVTALSEGHGSGVGAIDVDGQMVDEAVAAVARRVLARADGGLR
ncbi:HpcH/HpaI aldolase/citrate lyase family protein [Nocardia jinanensis]|uniref:Citrate lyase beta chain n=1 Tax=Nocardia jinanensis TaxID=382504 RepID=A0A917RJU0_9NOCA|nr:CoA ester lyase [Nocardia jinanensis]GGL10087.1 putative citrate lyase beta chain [Nocardia jinanensis]